MQPAMPTWPLSPSIQDHMVREEAKSLTPKQCAVVELALDTIKVRGRTPAHPRWGRQRVWLGEGPWLEPNLIHLIYKCFPMICLAGP